MRRPNLIAVLAVAAAFAGANAALAGGKGSTPSSTPPGFDNTGGHNGFEEFTHTTTSNGGETTTSTHAYLPGGWDEGKAAWKSGLQAENPNLATRPPGLKGH